MPEACFLCIDSSNPMRNGDFFPTRLMSTQEAANLLLGAKLQKNPENTIGFLTMGGKACTVMETLTQDLDRVMASVTKIAAGGSLHFAHGLQIASLALSHRLNPRAEKRIVAFVGSPIKEEAKQLEKLAKKLRKDEVAVDIVAYGVEENVPILESFIGAVNKANNSHLLFVPAGQQISDVMLTSAVVYGEEAAAMGGAGGAAAPGGATGPGGAGGFEFGVDPSVDPELAMVLRMSMEEERRRQEREAAAAGGGSAAPPAGDSAAPPAESAPAPAPSASEPVPGVDRPLTEEEEIELALKMSMQAEEAEASSAPPAQSEKPEGGSLDPAFSDAVGDADFMKELEEALKKSSQDDDKDKK